MTEEQWKKLKTLYGQAREVESSGRSAFLDAACGGDERLRREVELLLEYGDKAEAEAFLDGRTSQQTAMEATWTGRRIAHYAVAERIGVGGMGEVYRATDTRLGRDVAIKVLPPSFAGDPERRKRFEREARALAALNHPNIGAIYGIEEAGDGCALVLELVEGPTLADRLKSGPIPIRESLRMARQLADALETAHAKPIIHRDLKPANIKITPNGLLKVLDFGLAKALANEASARNFSQAPTGTGQGVVLGTPAYMSPEQAAGDTESIDARTDIWGFGCVLYEMLCGARPFGGDSVAATLRSVLASEPDWNALPPDVPESVKSLLWRCLAKDPKQRMHHIADARIELDHVISATTATMPPPQTIAVGRRMPRAWPGIAIAGSFAIAATVGYLYVNPGSEPANPIKEERQITFQGTDDPIFHTAISPDGRWIVYNNTTSIHIQSLDENGEPTVLSDATPSIPDDFCFK